MQRLFIFAALLIFAVAVWAPVTTVEESKKAVSKDSTQHGYLNRASPVGLRFASPPKPPVAYLAPLAITHDPQPVFSAQFVEPITYIEVAPSTNQPSPPPITSLQWPEVVTTFTNTQVKIPEVTLPEGPINPQMFVRFFHARSPFTNQPPGSIDFHLPVKDQKNPTAGTGENK